MLDIKRIRENTQEVKDALKRRGVDYSDKIDEVIKVDEDRRNLASKVDTVKAKQNMDSKLIPQYKKEGKDVSELMDEMKKLADEVKVDVQEVARLEKLQEELLLMIPNTPDVTVPDGLTDVDNVEIRKWGTPRNFGFEAKPHWEIGKDLDILDPERAAKVTGARFHFYKGLGSRLERSIFNFYLDLHTTQHGYTEMFPPFIANGDSMRGTGQLPKFQEDMYKIEGEDWYLIPTAEVPVTNYHRDEILDGSKLPYKYCAYSACFRAEAGSAGRDTRGLIRQHEFNKVEMVKFARPDQSWAELETLTGNAEHALQLLGLPYRVIALCAGDMGFSSAKTYDIEVWLPSYNAYKEISSCSNFTDYQARRMSIRYKNDQGDKAQLIHTLNGSGLAIGRTTAAIIENYQNEDGSITVPEVLVPYMSGVTRIEKKDL
ncbi:MAG: serine--tRNA ligase [Oscillospiraceae bacterium]